MTTPTVPSTTTTECCTTHDGGHVHGCTIPRDEGGLEHRGECRRSSGPYAVWTGGHPDWCEESGTEHRSLFFADLHHWRNLGSVDLCLEPFDKLGRKAGDKTQGDLYPATAGVILRGGIGSAAAVVLHLDGPGHDVDPDLTAREARALAALLARAADLLDGRAEVAHVS